MGWQIINGIPYRQGGGSSWSSYWKSQDLNLYIKEDSRDGLTLQDSLNPGVNDASILLPYFNKPDGDEYYYYTDKGGLDINSGSFTLGGWIKTDAKDAAYYLLGKNISGAADGRYGFGQLVTSGYLTFYIQSTGGLKGISSTVDGTSGWHFLFGEVDFPNLKLRFYIDGDLIGETSLSGTIPQLADIYRFYVGAGNRSDGQVDRISKGSFYDCFAIKRLLTSEEKTNSMKSIFPSDCVVIYPLMNYGFDASGNNCDLTPVNIDPKINTKFSTKGTMYGFNNNYSLYTNGFNEVYVPFTNQGVEIVPSALPVGYVKSIEGSHEK